MVFSSFIFIFGFLPIVLILYFLMGKGLRNTLLLIASLIFYAWGEPVYIWLMLTNTLVNYTLGLLIDKYSEKKKISKGLLISSVVINLGILMFYKYSNFFADNLNLLFNNLGISYNLAIEKLPLPIGISFYTFHSLSYIIDIYRGNEKAQRNILDLALYIAFFPQLVAGPIIKYHDISKQLKNRIVNIEKAASGLERFILGLGKKLIIADTMARVADNIFMMNTTDISTPLAWAGAIAYTIQIYFDFSAYSDMAIGLARIVGFDFLENFNYPYISTSIQDFWRRWHISLSTWFRDYLYIPLGGSRKGSLRTGINTLIVFTLCGFWHGATWNFVIWGLYYGIILAAEKLVYGKLLSRLWKPIRHIYTMFLVILGWVIFRADSLTYGIDYIKVMFGQASAVVNNDMSILNNEVKFVFVAALIFSTPIFQLFNKLRNEKKKYRILIRVASVIMSIFIFSTAILYLAPTLDNSKKVPFIYFRF